MKLQSEIQRKLAGRMSFASHAFLWFALAGIVGVLSALAFTQRWFTPTIELYFYAPTAAGLNRGMAVKLSGFSVGSLEQVSLVGESRVRGKVVLDRRYRDSVGKDAHIRLTRESVIGANVLEVILGPGDTGPVENGSTLTYERELDYSAVVAGLVERIGPVLDDIRKVVAGLDDPDGRVQTTVRHFDEAAVALRALAMEGSRLARDMPGRIDPVLSTALGSLTRAETVLGDAQRSLARTESMLNRMDAALPGMIEDTRRSLQSARAAAEVLNRSVTEDVPRVLRRGENLLEDADEVMDAVKRAWPVRSMLPPPRETLIELDSADGAARLLRGNTNP